MEVTYCYVFKPVHAPSGSAVRLHFSLGASSLEGGRATNRPVCVVFSQMDVDEALPGGRPRAVQWLLTCSVWDNRLGCLCTGSYCSECGQWYVVAHDVDGVRPLWDCHCSLSLGGPCRG